VLLTEHFQAEVGGHGGHDLQQSRRNTFEYERKRAIDFGANLRANFRLSSFYQHQIKIPSLVLVIAAKHGLESLQRLRSHFSTACTATSIRFASDVRTISLCCDFFGGEECLWFFFLHLFSARITFVIFCHNDCLQRIYVDPDRKGRSKNEGRRSGPHPADWI